jgi:hypothetical protein
MGIDTAEARTSGKALMTEEHVWYTVRNILDYGAMVLVAFVGISAEKSAIIDAKLRRNRTGDSSYSNRESNVYNI